VGKFMLHGGEQSVYRFLPESLARRAMLMLAEPGGARGLATGNCHYRFFVGRQDVCNMPPFEAIKISFDYLKNLRLG
jgi:hypothetical protein